MGAKSAEAKVCGHAVLGRTATPQQARSVKLRPTAPEARPEGWGGDRVISFPIYSNQYFLSNYLKEEQCLRIHPSNNVSRR